MTAIPFNRPPFTGRERQHVISALESDKMSGDGPYTQRCQAWFEKRLGCARALLTPSCTHALEMAALIVDIRPGDEVIMPSYTFVSTANAFVLRGASIVFVDVCPDTMNIDARRIESAITSKTKAIVPVHYGGVGCNMAKINAIAEKHGLFVIEDAAQGIMASYDGRPLGTLGHLGAYSFHETKNVTSGGEGGLLIVNSSRFVHRSEIIREKGTNRSQFFRGLVDKYTWVDAGSSYLPSELQAAYLWGQLQDIQIITESRRAAWANYSRELQGLADAGEVSLPAVPSACYHNGHLFYLKCKSNSERDALLTHLREQQILAVFHYVPLHSAPAGLKFSRFHGEDQHTTRGSECLVRLPLWYDMPADVQSQVIQAVKDFYS